MDTKADFLFLLEHVADKFNPFQDGEYLVIQVRSKNLRLRPLHRGFDYQEARSFCDFENLANDYSTYGLRIMHNGKLHHVDGDGLATTQSKEQQWLIHEDYYNARFVDNLDCEIEVCDCSYPVFWSFSSGNPIFESNQVWQPITCLIDDSGREIDSCPNCGTALIEEMEEETEEEDGEQVPSACVGCQYYNSGGLLTCTIHPLGAEGEDCPDYSQHV